MSSTGAHDPSAPWVSLGPLRREAGERKGPIAKQWGGEVVSDKHGGFCGASVGARLTLPRFARAPPSPPAMTRAERASRGDV